MRPSIVVGLAAVVLFITPQGRDVLATYSEQVFYRQFIFVVTALFAATATWYSARVLFDRWLKGETRGWAESWLPRLLGGAVVFLPTFMLLFTDPDGDDWKLITSLGIAGIVFVLLVWARRLVLEERFPKLRDRHHQTARRLSDLTQISVVGQQFLLLPLVGGNFAFTFLMGSSPQPLGDLLGPGGVAMLACALAVITASWLVHLSEKTKWPLFSGLIFTAIVTGLLFGQSGEDSPRYTRPNAELPRAAPVNAWLEVWRAERQHGDEDSVFVVAAAGGGVRAAAWTSLVLLELDRLHAELMTHDVAPLSASVFSVSGVSGGSLGAVLFAAIVRVCGYDEACRYRMWREFFGKDLLSANLGGLFFVDGVRNVMPFLPLLGRGRALELSWEDAFDRAVQTARAQRCSAPGGCAGSGALEDKFLDAARDGFGPHPLPHLMLNSTAVHTGNRLIFSTMRLPEAEFRRVFPAAHDAFDHASRLVELSMSEAAHNSARFPIISPAQTLSNGSTTVKVVDGGYYDNSGLETASDLVRALLEASPGAAWPITMIHIGSDPLPGDSSFCQKAPAAISPCELIEPTRRLAEGPGGAPFLEEIGDPLFALLNTRSGHGVTLQRRIAEFGDAEQRVRVVRFGLCKEQDSERTPPLSWNLSHKTRDAIAGQMAARRGNLLAACNITCCGHDVPCRADACAALVHKRPGVEDED